VDETGSERAGASDDRARGDGARDDGARDDGVTWAGHPPAGMGLDERIEAAARSLFALMDQSRVAGLGNLLCDEALDGLRAIPATKDTKALTDKIQAALKKAKLTT